MLVTTDPSGVQPRYVSVKTVEFHLGHIFDKLGIRSRKDLITGIGTVPPHPAGNLGS